MSRRRGSSVDWIFNRTRSAHIEYPLLTSFVALEIIFLLIPTLIVVFVSLESRSVVIFPPSSLSLRWYAQIPNHPQYIEAFIRSVEVAVMCTLLAIPIGISTGIGLIRYDIRFGNVIQVYLLLPFTVPLVVSGVILLILFGRLGVIGELWTVGIALTIINIPFMIWSVTSRVNALNPELEHAAKNLGADELQTFIYVTLPSIMPGVITGSLIMFVLGMNEFIVSLIITTPQIVTLPVELYTAIRANISPLIAAIASIYVIVAFITVYLADRIVGLEEFLRS